jgi:hypothetical protein
LKTLPDLMARFLSFEAQHDPMGWDVAGAPVWAYIRQLVFDDLSEQYGLHAERQASLRPRYAEAAISQRRDAGHVLHRYAYGRLRPAPILFLSHPRHYVLEGRHVSPYTHFLLQTLPKEAYWDLQFSDAGRHHVDDGLDRVLYLDLLFQGAFKAYALKHRWGAFRNSLRRASSELGHTLGRHLGASPNADVLEKRIWNAIRVHHGWGSVCDWLLDRIQPELIVNVVHYNWPTIAMTLRARQRNIVIAELQHGTVSVEHIAYNHGTPGRVPASPDYFLSFGEFWSKMVQGLHLPPSQMPAVGFSWLENRMASLSSPTRGKNLLVLSQRSIGVELSKLAVEAAKQLQPHGWRVIYRLHSGEVADWRERLPWLDTAQVEVCTGATDLYRRFGEAAVQLGVYSTALFEGVAFALPTLIARLPGAEGMSPLVDLGGARFVADAGEVSLCLQEVGSWRAPTDLVQRVWQPRAAENFRNFIGSHARVGS